MECSSDQRRGVPPDRDQRLQKGEISVKVKKLNDVAIIPVADARMKTAFTFNDGTTENQEACGVAPAAAAKNVGVLSLPKSAASLVKKTEKIRIFERTKTSTWMRTNWTTAYTMMPLSKEHGRDRVCLLLYGGSLMSMYHLVRENVHKYAVTVSRRDQLLRDGFHLVVDDPPKAPVVSDGARRSRNR